MRQLAALLLILAAALSPALAQEGGGDGCSAEALARQQDTFAQFLTLDFAADGDLAIANLYRLGALYQTMALDCGYQPNLAEIDRLLAITLRLVSLDDLIAAQSVGADLPAIMLDLSEMPGDPLRGQLLYNGLEPALGGAILGCAGCHENEQVAPLTAGTWTRIDELRLALAEFLDYSHRQFLVESIVQPNAYITPEYAAVMPDIYGQQLTPQQLADLVAFLESQDQLLDADA